MFRSFFVKGVLPVVIHENEDWGKKSNSAKLFEKTIVITSGSRGDISLIKATLSGNYNLIFAQTVEEAAHILTRRIDVSLMILDMEAQAKTICHTLERLSKLGILRRVAVIVAASSDGVESNAMILNAGASDILTKPLS